MITKRRRGWLSQKAEGRGERRWPDAEREREGTKARWRRSFVQSCAGAAAEIAHQERPRLNQCIRRPSLACGFKGIDKATQTQAHSIDQPESSCAEEKLEESPGQAQTTPRQTQCPDSAHELPENTAKRQTKMADHCAEIAPRVKNKKKKVKTSADLSLSSFRVGVLIDVIAQHTKAARLCRCKLVIWAREATSVQRWKAG